MHLNLIIKPDKWNVVGMFSAQPLTDEEIEMRLEDARDRATDVWRLTFIGSRAEVGDYSGGINNPLPGPTCSPNIIV